MESTEESGDDVEQTTEENITDIVSESTNNVGNKEKVEVNENEEDKNNNVDVGNNGIAQQNQQELVEDEGSNDEIDDELIEQMENEFGESGNDEEESQTDSKQEEKPENLEKEEEKIVIEENGSGVEVGVATTIDEKSSEKTKQENFEEDVETEDKEELDENIQEGSNEEGDNNDEQGSAIETQAEEENVNQQSSKAVETPGITVNEPEGENQDETGDLENNQQTSEEAVTHANVMEDVEEKSEAENSRKIEGYKAQDYGEQDQDTMTDEGFDELFDGESSGTNDEEEFDIEENDAEIQKDVGGEGYEKMSCSKNSSPQTDDKCDAETQKWCREFKCREGLLTKCQMKNKSKQCCHRFACEKQEMDDDIDEENNAMEEDDSVDEAGGDQKVHEDITSDIKAGETVVHYFYRGESNMKDIFRPHHCAPAPLCMVNITYK